MFGYIDIKNEVGPQRIGLRESRHNEQTAGPSTAPLAMRLREVSLRMTNSISANHLGSNYMSIRAIG